MARAPGDSDFTNVNVVTCVKVAGTQVVSTQQAAIAKVASALDTNTLVNVVNVIIDTLATHGLVAT